MQFSFENNIEDIIALTSYQMNTNPTFIKRRKWNLIGSPLFLLLAFIVYAALAGKPAFAIGGVIGAIFSFGWSWKAYRNYPRKAVEQALKNKPQTEVFCRHTITITSDGFEEKTTESQSFLTWKAIVDIAFTPEYIFVFNTPATAHVIPLRELGEAQFQQVGIEIRKYIRA